MANYLKGEVEIQTGDGRKHLFRLGVNEMINAQEALGLVEDDQKFLVVLSGARSFRVARVIVHCGLRGAQPDLTLEQAGDILTEIGLVRFGEIIEKALRWALPERKQQSEQEGKKPRPSGGPTSS